MKKPLIAVIFLLFSVARAYVDADSLIISYNAEGNVTINHYSSAAELISLTQKVYLYIQGKEYLESDFNDFIIIDESGLNVLKLTYYGDTDKINWGFNAIISSSRELHNLSFVPEFPYDTDELPSTVKKYLTASSLIDSNQAIVNKANEVVAGASNYLEAAGVLAEWVSNNIDYTPTNQLLTDTIKSSVVLETRQGVCDEFSVLFMSLARAVGLPAKYVYGYAYSDLENIEGFGPHSWVEVYVPGHGWIPFDLTYKQYGWLDPSHLKTYSSYNVTKNLVSTNANAYDPQNIELINDLPDYLLASLSSSSVGFINIDSSVDETELFDASINISKSILAEDEYFLVTLSVNNPFPYYIPISFTLATTPQMIFVEGSGMHNFMLLKPNEVTNKHLLFKTPEIGSPVIHPINVKLPGAADLSSSVTVFPNRVVTTTLQSLMSLIESTETPVSNLIVRSLSINPGISYGEQPFINLSLRNNGTIPLSNITVEVASTLLNPINNSISELSINEVSNLLIPLELSGNEGFDDVTVFVRSEAGVSAYAVEFIKAVKPLISIDFSGKTDYLKGEDTNFSITISNNNLKNISLMTISLITDRAVSSGEYCPRVNNLTINYELPVSVLHYGNNSVNVLIDYYDDHATLFSESLSFDLYLKGTWFDYLIQWFDSVFRAFINLFSAG